MKAYLIITTLAAVAIVVATQHSMELTLAAAALWILLMLLLWILRRNMEVVFTNFSQTVSFANKSPRVTPKSASSGSAETFTSLDSSVFARFRENLEQNERKQGNFVPVPEDEPTKVVNLKRQPVQTEPEPVDADGFEQALATAEQQPPPPKDRVTIRGRNNTAIERPRAQTLRRHSDIGSLYSLSKQRLSRQPEIPDSTEDLFSDAYIPLPHQLQAPTPAKEDLYDEGLGKTLGHSASPDETRDEAEALLQMARSFARARNWQEAKVSLDNHLQLLQELKRTPQAEDLQLYVKALIELGEIQQAAHHLDGVRRQKDGLEGEDLARMVRDVVEGLEKEQAWETMIPLLQDLLNYARQQLDRNEMDRLYDKLEQALETTKEEDRLVRTCHSHLEIKRAIGDVEGEERLLSKLGRLHHRRGDKEMANQLYQDTLRLRNSMERADY
ncbi:MAG: hypothetical protein CL915_00070 [Deltaproteobacteria bacterium]|nr:hypothetical protein [Deltaproteobacteria bacterium]